MKGTQSQKLKQIDSVKKDDLPEIPRVNVSDVYEKDKSKIPGVDVLDGIGEENSRMSVALEGQTDNVGSTSRTTFSEDLGLVMQNGSNGQYNLHGNYGQSYQHHYNTNTFSLEGEESRVVLAMITGFLSTAQILLVL